MVIREYLVENFGLDDSQLRTLAMGKQEGANLEADWGSIQILIYPGWNSGTGWQARAGGQFIHT